AVSFHRDEPTDGVIGVGTYIPSLRLVVTANTDAIGTNLPRTLTVVFADKSSQRATLLKSNASTHLYTFEAGLPLPGGANSALATAEDIKQGQTVIA
ncbi:hypothetical protein LRR18_17955, partial [Mangrovimonas sp. AS39]|uniref:hypothetical protein n=1 Tax=Mangrovimonas futianensis TaxID=2895523 RepID=UPI001E60D174